MSDENADRDAFERAAEDYRALYEAAVEEALAAAGDRDPERRALFAVTLARSADAPATLQWQHGQRSIPDEVAINRLYASLFIDAAEQRFDAYAIVTPTEMTHETTREVHDAVAIDMEHREADPVTIFVVVERTDDAAAPRAGRTIPVAGRRVVFVDEGSSPGS